MINEAELIDMVEPESAQEESFFLKNDSMADWALEKRLAAIAEYARMEMLINDKVGIYKRKLMEAYETKEKAVGFFTGLLRTYFEKVDATMNRPKTKKVYKLAAGELTLKLGKPAIVRPAEGEADLLDFVQHNHPEFVEVEEFVAWRKFKTTLEIKSVTFVNEDGEIIPTLAVVDAKGTPVPTLKVETTADEFVVE